MNLTPCYVACSLSQPYFLTPFSGVWESKGATFLFHSFHLTGFSIKTTQLDSDKNLSTFPTFAASFAFSDMLQSMSWPLVLIQNPFYERDGTGAT